MREIVVGCAALFLSCAEYQEVEFIEKYSSGEVTPSSSSEQPSSSSISPPSSSSDSPPSSSSENNLCADFDPEEEVLHCGAMKEWFCDPRNDERYPYVEIGEPSNKQIWMAKNLNYYSTEPDAVSVCYDNNDANCNTYGRLYNFATANYCNGSCKDTP